MKLMLMFVFEKEFLGSSPFEYIMTNTLHISTAMFSVCNVKYTCRRNAA